MATFGYIIKDVDATQISQIMDMARKKVNENQRPINVSLSLSLKEKADKINIIKGLLEELKRQDLWGKVDISFPETKFSSDEIRQITAEMSKYKDKAVNFSFDSIANNFSKEDTAEILRACNNSMSTTYPFTAMARDGIPDALREKFLENNPNIIYTGGSNPNFTKLKKLLGFESNDIRGEIISNADKRHMSAAQYARYLVSTMDASRLNEIKKYTLALDRLSMEYNSLSLANLQKNGYDDVNAFFKTVKSSMEEKIQSQEKTNSTEQAPSFAGIDSEKYFEILESRDVPAATLWEAAKAMEKNNPEGRYTSYAVSEVINRDPKFNPHEMLAKINDDVTGGYFETDGGRRDEITEIADYRAAARDIERLVANNPDISNTRALLTLNRISKDILGYNTSEDFELEDTQRNAIIQTISAYQQCSYQTPSLAVTAINNIGQLSKVGKLPGVIYDTLGTINAVHAIFNKSKPNKDIARASLRVLKDAVPMSFDEAKKMLSVYRKIGWNNPEMGTMVAMNIVRTFNQCPEDNIKKECLKTLTILNTFRGDYFEADIRQKMDQYYQNMKRRMNINAGKPTNTPNPQSRTGR